MTPHRFNHTDDNGDNGDRLVRSVMHTVANTATGSTDPLPLPTTDEVRGLRHFLASQLNNGDGSPVSASEMSAAPVASMPVGTVGSRDRHWAWAIPATAAALGIIGILAVILMADPGAPGKTDGDGRSMATNTSNANDEAIPRDNGGTTNASDNANDASDDAPDDDRANAGDGEASPDDDGGDPGEWPEREDWPTVRDRAVAAGDPTAFIAALRWRTVTAWRNAFETWISGGGIPMQTAANDWRVRGLLAARQDDATSAVADIAKAADMDGGNAMIHSELAAALVGVGKQAAARASLDRALALAPGHAALWLQRARLFVALGMFENALADIDNAIQLDPMLIDAYLLRAQVFMRLGRIEQAHADVCRAIELDPRRAQAFEQRARVLQLMGRDEEAKADHRRADAARGWPEWTNSATDAPAWTARPPQTADQLRFVIRQQASVTRDAGAAANQRVIAQRQRVLEDEAMTEFARRGAMHAWMAALPESDGVPIITAFTDTVTGNIRVLERVHVRLPRPGETRLEAWLLCEVSMDLVLESAPAAT